MRSRALFAAARRACASLCLLLLASSCSDRRPGPTSASTSPKADRQEPGSLSLTTSFDGSQNYRMWTATLELARQLGRDHGADVRFSYFINGMFYDAARVSSAEELLVRVALTQQAINEGHDIGSHGMYHEDGGEWTVSRWSRDFEAIDALVGALLFEPARDGEGRALFPQWRPLPGARDSEPGAACARDGDCASGLCIPVAPDQRFCSQVCDGDTPCPAGLGCGGGVWHRFWAAGQLVQDLCLPPPAYPVVHEGTTLFDDAGHATPAALARGLLRPYKMIGARAPFLAAPTAMHQAMFDHGYAYDASQVRPNWSNPCFELQVRDRPGSLWIFGIMAANTLDRSRPWGTYSWPMPFDSVYYEFGLKAAAMESQYRASLLTLHEMRDQIPAWNINAHFSWWIRDTSAEYYWDALQRVLHWAAAGCPADGGEARCPEMRFPSFRQLADH